MSNRLPYESPDSDYTTWTDIASASLVVLALFALLWFAANPLVGIATVLGLISLRTAFRRARAGLEFVGKNCCIVLWVGERVRITLGRSPMEG